MFNVSSTTLTTMRFPPSIGTKIANGELSYETSSLLDKYQRKVILRQNLDPIVYTDNYKLKFALYKL